MSENKISILPDVIEPVSNAIQQNIPITANQTDETLSTVVGFFNNVVLYPVKKANLTFKYKLEAFEDDLKEKIQHIPEENLQLPPTMIAGPVLESLRYTYDEEELREMYENLLASAMDNRVASKVHPSFVDIIKQLTPDEAKLLKCISKKNIYPLIGINMSYSDAGHRTIVKNFTDIAYGICEFPLSIFSYLDNFERLKLIDIYSDTWLTNEILYESLKSHPYIQKILNDSVESGFKYETKKGMFELTSYGKDFIKVCL